MSKFQSYSLSSSASSLAARTGQSEMVKMPGALPLSPLSSTHLAEQILFLSRNYKELKVEFDQNARSIWCYLRPNRSVSFTPGMIRELVLMMLLLMMMMMLLLLLLLMITSSRRLWL
jgi:hypothetical protein